MKVDKLSSQTYKRWRDGALVYLVFFILYHIIWLPLQRQARVDTQSFPFSLPSTGSCILFVQYPTSIPTQTIWDARLSPPVILRAICPHTSMEKEPPLSIIIRSPQDILIQDKDAQPISGQFEMLASPIESMAEPVVFWLTYLPESFQFLAEQTSTSFQVIVADANVRQSAVSRRIQIQRTPWYWDMAGFLLDLLFGQKLFGVFGSLIGFYAFSQERTKQKQEQREQILEKTRDILREGTPSEQMQRFFELYEKENDPQLANLIKQQAQKVTERPGWKTYLASRLLEYLDEMQGEDHDEKGQKNEKADKDS